MRLSYYTIRKDCLFARYPIDSALVGSLDEILRRRSKYPLLEEPSDPSGSHIARAFSFNQWRVRGGQSFVIDSREFIGKLNINTITCECYPFELRAPPKAKRA